MTRIYLDPSALMLPSIDPAEPAGDEHAAPRSFEAVAHLVDAGFEVVLLGEGWGATLPPGAERAEGLPEHLDTDAWYLTGEPYPSFGRPRGGTTVLVGPKRPAGKLPLPRFDLEARDLSSAVMEILTRDAMA